MSTNFRRFNARIGVVFAFQHAAIRLFSWKVPSHTMSFLAIYTLIALDPALIAVAPLAICIFFIMIPAFLARHPAPAVSLPGDLEYSLEGPALAPPTKIKPVSEMSKEFFRNLRDLQNTMKDFSDIHDLALDNIGPPTNFANEALSSGLLVILLMTSFILFIAAHLIPWRLLVLVAGWGAVLAGHPYVQALIAQYSAQQSTKAPKPAQNQTLDPAKAIALLEADIVVEGAPQRREVEVFELQTRPLHRPSAEWESFVFSPLPYTPLSASRINGDRPKGTRFFEDVLPPKGYRWVDKKWTLDLLSKEWVEERCITGVEVEVEGERWVSDILYDDEKDATDVEVSKSSKSKPRDKAVTWEEGKGGDKPLGEWRRRRWFRVVERMEDRRVREEVMVAPE